MAMLAMLSTKATFSEQQRAEILALGQQQDKPTAVPAPAQADPAFVADMESQEAPF